MHDDDTPKDDELDPAEDNEVSEKGDELEDDTESLDELEDEELEEDEDEPFDDVNLM